MSEALAQKLALPPDCRRVLCAVSGGADSVCMLSLLCRIAPARGLVLFAAHYEHGIRGEESLRDEAFVRALCEQLGVPLLVEHGDVPTYAREHHLSLETAARELRYRFFAKAAAHFACDCVATAHNADDNAETLLLHLARGSGAKGLQGIPARRGNIVRPMLAISRSEIERYLKDNAIRCVEDSSNASNAYSRNLIRHQVMPALRRINPSFTAAAARTAALLRQDDEFLCAQAQCFLETGYDGGKLDRARFAALHPAVASRVVRALWPHALSQTHVETLLALSRSGERCFADLPGGKVRLEQGGIYFCREEEGEIPERLLVPGQTLDVPEAGVRLRTYFASCTGEIYGLFKTYSLKCESIYGNLKCTGRLPGDRFAPAGRGCTKSLRSLFKEAHMTRRQRDRTLVVRDDRGILAVAGFGVDRRCVPAPGDDVLCIEIEKTE